MKLNTKFTKTIAKSGLRRHVFFLLLVLLAQIAQAQNIAIRQNPLDMRFRQLMLDDRVMVRVENAEKIYPQLEKCDQVLLVGNQPWEGFPSRGKPSVVYLFGSVLRDPQDSKYKMWYQVIHPPAKSSSKKSYDYATCYAESKDGLQWHKPHLGNVDYRGDGGKNNIVAEQAAMPHVFIVDDDLKYRFRLYWPHPHRVGLSRDGKKIDRVIGIAGKKDIPGIGEMLSVNGKAASDNLDIMYDPVEKLWRGVFKTWTPLSGSVTPGLFRRTQAFATSKDGITNWTFSGRSIAADLADDRYVQTVRNRKKPHQPAWAEMYCFPHFAYEGLLIGFPTLFYKMADLYNSHGEDAEIFLAWSGDRVYWNRPRVRTPFIANGSEGGPDDGFLLVAVTPPLRHNHQLWIYYTANPHRHGSVFDRSAKQPLTIRRGSLRVDGWAAYRASKGEEAILHSQHFVADGQLTINADCRGGEFKVEVMEATLSNHKQMLTLKPLPGFSKHDAQPIRGDVSRASPKWKNRAWSELKGKTVQLRFYFNNAALYSFGTINPKPR